tara:strand:+ start:255 stop:1199 length:945 start_codon:yes stop_codon:yes gene_type:complete
MATIAKFDKFILKLKYPTTKREWKNSIAAALFLLTLSYAAWWYRGESINSCYGAYQIAITEKYKFHQTQESAPYWVRMKDICAKEILEGDDFGAKELYAMFRIYDQIYQKIMPDNKKYLLDKSQYHRYLYFANRHSNGKYKKELKEFEINMTRFEKMKSYLALSSMLLNEKFVTKKDPEKSLYYLKKAANLGDTPAQIQLSGVYISSQGGMEIKKDIAESFKWQIIASYLGRNNAISPLNDDVEFYNKRNIKHYITNEDIKNEEKFFLEGKRRAQIWINSNKSNIEKYKLRRYANRKYNDFSTYEKTLKDNRIK